MGLRVPTLQSHGQCGSLRSEGVAVLLGWTPVSASVFSFTKWERSYVDGAHDYLFSSVSGTL